MTRQITVDAEKLDKAIMLVGGRVWNALDHGHPLDDYDGERIREALALLQEMSGGAKA